MEFKNDAPCLYMTAPSSPNGHSMEFYYSAPASPQRAMIKAGGDNLSSRVDEFEFGTSKRFSGERESPVSGDRGHERGDSLPAMAFADELFLNGLVMPLELPLNGVVMPLKPPPRLHKSALSSPRSPATVCRIPFARKSSRNDDFDPFMVALEKVREEKRGRNSHHRSSRSYSPFRAFSRSSTTVTHDNDAQSHSPDLLRGNSLVEPMPAPALASSFSGPLDFKGSAYARWVRDQSRHGLSPKSPSRLLFRQRVRPLSGSDKPPSPAANHVGKRRGNVEASKVQKLKGLLVKYASFGRGHSGSKQTKMSTEAHNFSYFGRLSFRFKGNGHGNNTKKTIPANAKMAVVPYKPSAAFCLA
ncbi:hypothetical protein SASPL_126739 [Salvia splendens]|uniref:Uncharacterized protein n=1 Tax=Salvia splendens TaxID=180675 RepID=A0A8X8XI85_SALSN|nr:hypothetical protein SASPL_126739 [Salvia splendens]